MISLKSQLDSKGKDRRDPEKLRQAIKQNQGFTDADEISDRYIAHIAFDLGNAAGGRNFERVYGKIRLYAPQKPVTRSEAAVLLSQFRQGRTLTLFLERGQRKW